MTLLTDKEIFGIVSQRYIPTNYCETSHTHKMHRKVSQAQLKKVYEWGGEVCSDETHHSSAQHRYRRHCLVCWDGLLKEVEDA